ncbi:MAG: hypothetical protein IAF38_17280 [Bacteroidia bacterium]|nr:hypothetical protein [Bacteroidia bacterium]
MKKLIAGILLLSVATFTADAQVKREHSNNGKAHGKMEHKKMKHDVAEKLNLSETQKTQMKTINEDFRTKMKSLEGSSATEPGYDTRKKALIAERKQKIEALLTPDQKAQKTELKKEYRFKKHNGKKGDRAESIKTNLGLSNDQVAKMKAQQEIFKTKEIAIKQNSSLTQEQRTEQLKALRLEKKNSFKTFLTPEQIKKLDAMHQHHNRSMKTS